MSNMENAYLSSELARESGEINTESARELQESANEFLRKAGEEVGKIALEIDETMESAGESGRKMLGVLKELLRRTTREMAQATAIAAMIGAAGCGAGRQGEVVTSPTMNEACSGNTSTLSFEGFNDGLETLEDLGCDVRDIGPIADFENRGPDGSYNYSGNEG